MDAKVRCGLEREWEMISFQDALKFQWQMFLGGLCFEDLKKETKRDETQAPGTEDIMPRQVCRKIALEEK